MECYQYSEKVLEFYLFHLFLKALFFDYFFLDNAKCWRLVRNMCDIRECLRTFLHVSRIFIKKNQGDTSQDNTQQKRVARWYYTVVNLL